MLAFAEEFNIVMVIIDPKPLSVWSCGLPTIFLEHNLVHVLTIQFFHFPTFKVKEILGVFKKKEVTLQTEPGRSVLWSCIFWGVSIDVSTKISINISATMSVESRPSIDQHTWSRVSQYISQVALSCWWSIGRPTIDWQAVQITLVVCQQCISESLVEYR